MIEPVSLTELRHRKKEKFLVLKLHDAIEIQDHSFEAPRNRVAYVISIELGDTLKKMGLLE